MMEAKDTVIKLFGKYLVNEAGFKSTLRVDQDVAKAQAEISFKIGKTAGVAESLIPALKAIEASRKAGRREVMEWMQLEGHTADDFEAKLKEWGIELW